MRLSSLLQAITPLEIAGAGDPEITGLHYDSRGVKEGGLFFALKGVATDGHRYIRDARELGAAAVVLEEIADAGAGIPLIRVADARLAMALLADRFYGEPTSKLQLVGITGTNGKTTTTYLVEGILEAAGIATAVLGTISYRFHNLKIAAPHTTPESVELQKNLAEMVRAGARGAVMEVSSHALEQHRVDGCRFRVGLFTNLTRDHLDYHLDMETYFACKLRLFRELLDPVAGRAVVNLDDPYGARVAREASCPVITYGLDPAAQITVRNLELTVDGIRAEVITPLGTFPLFSQLLGRFNLANILAAVATGVALDLPLAAISKGLAEHLPVPGRLERVENSRGIALLVDYAHTSDALENVLRTLTEVGKGRLITVFGCGGDRDRGKRPLMGEVAARFSHLTIVTSDNPRTEEPGAIIQEILAGIRPLGLAEYGDNDLATMPAGKGYSVMVDRRAAIRLAVRVARPGDIVLLAGKGHEDYQIIGTEKHHFDDREEAALACKELS